MAGVRGWWSACEWYPASQGRQSAPGQCGDRCVTHRPHSVPRQHYEMELGHDLHMQHAPVQTSDLCLACSTETQVTGWLTCSEGAGLELIHAHGQHTGVAMST